MPIAISYAWTHDGGQSCYHAPLPGITKSAGGTWDRACDPVIAFGPDGTPERTLAALSSSAGRHVQPSCSALRVRAWIVGLTQPISGAGL